MHIIVVSSRLANTRSMTLSGLHLAAGACGAVALLGILSFMLVYFGLHFAAQLRIPALQSALASIHEEETMRAESFLRENLNAMAMKLGQMQAQLVRLESLGERVSSLAGLKSGEFRFNEMPGRGGAVASVASLSINDLSGQVEALARALDQRTDALGIIETTLFDARVRKRLLPTVTPVDSTWSASSFGIRIDPFTGQNAMHEGIDFIADVGTPVFAAAAGVVVQAAAHHQYGNMVEIDHGNDFVTRYAHASKLFVKAGDVVQRGRKIAEVGSTGRSTGPHLHFEVRYRGVAQNPGRFLRAAAN
jgi:murein DD-endopeptidase MepM/ murein hydrolase activator NlpD